MWASVCVHKTTAHPQSKPSTRERANVDGARVCVFVHSHGRLRSMTHNHGNCRACVARARCVCGWIGLIEGWGGEGDHHTPPQQQHSDNDIAVWNVARVRRR